MKKLSALILILLLILSLCACAQQTSAPDSASDTYVSGTFNGNSGASEAPGNDRQKEPNTADSAFPATAAQQFSADAGVSIDVLREEINQYDSIFGIAYIGYFDHADETGIGFPQWFSSASSPLAAVYPFVTEIDKQHTIGTQGHLYCVIAGDYDFSIEVSSIDSGDVLYRSENGDPILLFCSQNGDAQIADTAVSITAKDGKEYRWEAALDEWSYPQSLFGDEYELLSLDFSQISDTGFDLEGWLSEGWLGPTAVGLAGDDVTGGTDWWISTWDSSVSYCMSFYPNSGDSYDGEVVLSCYYAGDTAIQAEWQGWWRIDTEMEQPSRLYLDLMLMDGSDMQSFEYASVVSESYVTLIPQSGNYLLLFADGITPALPIFPDGVPAVELTLGVG